MAAIEVSVNDVYLQIIDGANAIRQQLNVTMEHNKLLEKENAELKKQLQARGNHGPSSTQKD